MDPTYLNVVDKADVVWTLFAYLTHIAIVFAQLSLACFLLATGVHCLLRPDGVGRRLRRVGAVEGTLPFGALRIGLGLLLLAPLATGASVIVSLAAGLAAFALLLRAERGLPAPGRVVRCSAIAFAAIASSFMIWEREDNLALAADVLLPAQEWRIEELAWQLERDPLSPKVGDLAPDFELQDPEGVTRVRLSDFRGKRPVALVFGSYT